MNPLYYQPSNKMPLGGIVLLLLGGTAVAAGLALAYVYAIWYIPFAYFNLLLCFGFGLLLGAALVKLVELGKLRHPAAVGWLSLAVGLAALYLEWGVFLTLVFNSETTGTGTGADTSTSFIPRLFLEILTHPAQMWEAVRQVNETGTWSLKGSTPTGLVLWVVWLLEAAVIGWFAYALPPAQAQKPFSETTGDWAADELLPHPLGYVADVPALRQSLESGHFEALAPCPDPGPKANYARLTLHSAPTDDSCQYLTLENITFTLDKKGNPQENATTIIPYLAISANACRQLRRRFGTDASASSPVENSPN